MHRCIMCGYVYVHRYPLNTARIEAYASMYSLELMVDPAMTAVSAIHIRFDAAKMGHDR